MNTAKPYYTRFLLIIPTLMLLSLLLMGCSQNAEPGADAPPAPAETPTVTPPPTRVIQPTIAATPVPVQPEEAEAEREPVTLDVGFVGDLPTVDPQQARSSISFTLIENIFAGLTNYNYQAQTIEPELAQNWSVSDDGRVWTFNLRDDIFWTRPLVGENDPTIQSVAAVRPVVADDLVYAVQRACRRSTDALDAFVLFVITGCEEVYTNPDTVTPEQINQIGVEAIDNTTFQVTLNEPASHFLAITSMWYFHPLPPELLESEETAETWQEGENLLTSGPFIPVPTSWGETRTVLQRNPLWPLPVSGNSDFINVYFLEEEENAFKLWQAKTLDVIPLPASERETMLLNAPTKVKLVPNQTLFYLGYNFDSPVFREQKVRQAFAAAIDRERLVSEIFGGRGLPMRHLTPPGVIGAPPPDQVGRGYDPDYARQQMNNSGFGSCKLMPSVTLAVSSADLSLRLAELVRDMWIEELGCTEDQIIIEQEQFGILLANTRPDAGAARPDIWELGWTTYYPDTHNWLNDLLHCEESENRQNRPCSEADNLIAQAAVITDPAERMLHYREIESLLFGGDNLEPISPLYISGRYDLVQSWLTYVPALFGGEQFDTYLIDDTLKQLERSR